MAKFNEYYIRAETEDGVSIVESTVTALGTEQAFHKAVSKAFESIETGTGDIPSAVMVWRRKNPSESQG